MTRVPLTVRMPRALQRSIQAEANRLGLSINEYMLRCCEARAEEQEIVMTEVEALVRFRVSTRATTAQIQGYVHQAVSQWRGQCRPEDPMYSLDHRSVEVAAIRNFGVATNNPPAPGVAVEDSPLWTDEQRRLAQSNYMDHYGKALGWKD